MHRYFSFLIFILTLSLFHMNTAYAASGIGRILYASGPVHIERYGKQVQVKRNRYIYQSDFLITGHRGRIKLRMNDNSIIFIGSKSRLSMKKFAMKNDNILSASFDLFWGKARFVVNKLIAKHSSFKVNTTTAVLGVRGTELTVHSDASDAVRNSPPSELQNLDDLPDASSSVTLTEGAVDVMSTISGVTRALTPGHTAFIDKSGLLEVHQTPYNDISSHQQNSRKTNSTSSSDNGLNRDADDSSDSNNTRNRRNGGAPNGGTVAIGGIVGARPNTPSNIPAIPVINATSIQQGVQAGVPVNTPINIAPTFVVP